MENKKKRRSIALELTFSCNQKCVYCYNAWRKEEKTSRSELPFDRLSRLIDSITDSIDVDHFTLTGGEPFLRSKIFEIIDHINEKRIPVAIISNAGEITPEIAHELSRREVSYVQATLTGHTAKIHDRLCGKGAFDNTINGIGNLTANNIRVGGSYLCTRDNKDSAFAVMELMKEVGALDHLAFNRFNPSGHALENARALMPTRSDVLIALKQANDFGEQEQMEIHCTMPIPHCMVDESQYPRVEFGQCSAGTSVAEYAVTPTGDLKLCTLHGVSLGNLFESNISDLIDSRAVKDFRNSIPDFCLECPYHSGCLGGCGAAAWWAFGTDAELDPFVAQHIMVDYEKKLGKNSRII